MEEEEKEEEEKQEDEEEIRKKKNNHKDLERLNAKERPIKTVGEIERER